MRRVGVLFSALALLALVPTGGEATHSPGQDAACGNDPATTTVEGTFTQLQEGSYVMVPFEVPAGTTRVRVRLSNLQQIPSQSPVRSTLDLGLYQPRDQGDTVWGAGEFRGWGGSSRLNACVSEREATLGFLPGPIPAGTWAAEIGVAAVVGAVDWRLEVFLSTDPALADPDWQPTAYDATPADPDPGWYRGDFHVHAEHSSHADSTMDETFDDAFGRAGLDFITLSDYVTTRHWDEIGAFQAKADHPGKLVIRSAEVITYRGHVNNHASLTWADYRTGPILERQADGTFVEIRAPVAPGDDGGIFDQVHGGGGWTQVNHPTTFPSKIPPFAVMCRGCSWEYGDDETDWSKVDAFEVQTGPAGTPDKLHPSQPVNTDGTLGPNPFTPLALEWFDRLQRGGFDITAVGSSDSHHADHQELTQSPIGEATTVVYAPELSEAGIRAGVLAGHAYVKFFGADGPDLRLTAQPLGGGTEVMMGDELEALVATFKAEVLGADTLPPTRPGPLTLVVLLDGAPYLSVPVVADEDGDFGITFEAAVPGDYRLQLVRGSAVEAVTNPINLETPKLVKNPGGGPSPPPGHGGRGWVRRTVH